MKLLKEKVKKNRFLGVLSILGVVTDSFDTSFNFDLENEEDFQKGAEISYSLKEKHRFSSDYYRILDAEIDDYGYLIDGEFHKNFASYDQSSELNLYIDNVNYQESEVTLRGSVVADLLAVTTFDNVIVRYNVHGLTKNEYEALSLFQELVYESYLLEIRKDNKLSFFSYFTAIEALVALYLEDYKSKIYSELHYSLEHLSLDDKIKVICKESYGIDLLSSIGLWGEFMGTFKKVKDKRNQIAHARSNVVIDTGDLDNVFYCLCNLIAVLEVQALDFKSVRQHIFN
ncbi:TPA: hypothetical protein NGS96_002747 [Vibrio parahaemolyticus]|nr:hypothetical protein [Vibrio parahaemolyticus]